MKNSRREFVKSLLAGTGLVMVGGLSNLAHAAKSKMKIVVVGGGFGGATFAKHIKQWLPSSEVTIIEKDSTYYSCPLSNRVISGKEKLVPINLNGIKKLGVNIVIGNVSKLDFAAKKVMVGNGKSYSYDKLVVSPGVELLTSKIKGLDTPLAKEKVVHAYIAGKETEILRNQIANLVDGEDIVLHIPKAPYRCPPAPYERACQMAEAIRNMGHQNSKVIVLDSNNDIIIEKDLFSWAFNVEYKNIIRYKPASPVLEFNAEKMEVVTEFDTYQCGVANIIPPMRAGKIAVDSGLTTSPDGNWCGVDFKTMESVAQKDVFVLGDSTFSTTGVPKAGHLANQEAKIAAAAMAAKELGLEIVAEPAATHTCYSFTGGEKAGHISAFYRYNPQNKMLIKAEGTGGMAKDATEIAFKNGISWWKNIMMDSFNAKV